MFGSSPSTGNDDHQNVETDCVGAGNNKRRDCVSDCNDYCRTVVLVPDRDSNSDLHHESNDCMGEDYGHKPAGNDVDQYLEFLASRIRHHQLLQRKC